MMKTSSVVRNGLMVVCMLFGMAFSTTAQDHECKKHQSNYGLRFNNGDYKGAYPFWQKFIESCPAGDKTCPCDNMSHWQNGAYMLDLFFREEQDPTRRKALFDSLVWAYETILTTYGKSHDPLMRYGILISTDPNRREKSHSLLRESLTDTIVDYNNMTWYAAQALFQVNSNMVREKLRDCNWLVEEYFWISDLIERKLKDGSDVEGWQSTQEQVDQLAAPCLSCEQLDIMISQKIKTLPEACEDKIQTINKFLNLLDKKDCKDSENFKTLAVMAYDCGKTSEAAHKLALMYWGDKNYAKAYEYIKEAMSLDKENTNVGKYNHDAAKIAQGMGSCSTAISHARKAVANGETKANKVIGDCIVAQYASCGNTNIKKRSVYWLGSDYYEKAGYGADYFKKEYPSVTELFEETIAVGSSYTVPCVGESTTVRAK